MVQVTNIEKATASNGKEYKKVTLAEKVQGKDMTNIFADHPNYSEVVEGADLDKSLLYINDKGYLTVGKVKDERGTGKSDTGKLEVKLGFMEQKLKTIDEKLNRLLEKEGLQTPAEKVEAVRDLEPDDVPF